MKSNHSKQALLAAILLFTCSAITCQDLNNSFRPGLEWSDNEGRHKSNSQDPALRTLDQMNCFNFYAKIP